jgi:hypothetical protein
MSDSSGSVTVCAATLCDATLAPDATGASSPDATGASVAGEAGCLHAPNKSASDVSATTLTRIILFSFIKRLLLFMVAIREENLQCDDLSFSILTLLYHRFDFS